MSDTSIYIVHYLLCMLLAHVSSSSILIHVMYSKHLLPRACKSRGLVFILKTSGALRLSLRYFNIEIPIQKVKFVFEDVVDEQFAELSKKIY